MNLKDTMMLYCVTVGKRYNNRDKKLFRDQLKEDLKKAGLDIQDQQGGSIFLRIHNMIAQNSKNPRILIVVPYDTPIRTVWTCDYYPFHPELSMHSAGRDLLIRFILSACLFVSAYLYVRTWNGLLSQIFAAILAIAGLILLHGWGNRFNFNRSSAAVALAVRLTETLGHNEDIALAFCDRVTIGYGGYRLLADNLPNVSSVLILDSIASGEKLALGYKKSCENLALELKSLLPDPLIMRSYDQNEVGRNVLSLFPDAMMLTSGTIRKKELVVKGTGTPDDIKVDIPRLEKIENALNIFISKQNNKKE